VEENETHVWGEGHGVGGRDSKKRMVVVVLDLSPKSLSIHGGGFLLQFFYSDTTEIKYVNSNKSRLQFNFALEERRTNRPLKIG